MQLVGQVESQMFLDDRKVRCGYSSDAGDLAAERVFAETCEA